MEITLTTVFGGLITVLLGIIGFFLRNIHNDFQDLKEQFQDFRMVLNTVEVKNDDFREKQTEKNFEFQTRFNRHDDRLNEHDKALATIKSKL